MEAAEGKNVHILEELNRDIENLSLNLKKFIKEQVSVFKKRGVVIGVSGGIDLCRSTNPLRTGTWEGKRVLSSPS